MKVKGFDVVAQRLERKTEDKSIGVKGVEWSGERLLIFCGGGGGSPGNEFGTGTGTGIGIGQSSP
jgi:hypothetical protein